MATLNQIEANQKNAQNCCGPKTPETKAISSMNALKTGIDAKSEVIRVESQAEFDALERLYARDGCGYPAVQSAVPCHAASQPDRAAENMGFDDSAGGILGHFLVVDELPHRFVRCRVGTVDLGGIARFQQVTPILFSDLKFSVGRADRANEPESLDSKLAEETA